MDSSSGVLMLQTAIDREELGSTMVTVSIKVSQPRTPPVHDVELLSRTHFGDGENTYRDQACLCIWNLSRSSKDKDTNSGSEVKC